MYKAMDLANYIVDKCIKDNVPITNLQLQRILYFVQKDFLKRGSPAFLDEIEAWEFGPVCGAKYLFLFLWFWCNAYIYIQRRCS